MIFFVGTNLFHPLSRIELDENLTEEALMVAPEFVPNIAMIPIQSALSFQLQATSPALSKWNAYFGK